MAQRVLTPQSESFPDWYQDVLAKAELAENGPARGTMVIRPWAYAIWERIQAELDRRIKATGHDNVYFPSLIPASFVRREAEHVQGFSPELAVVTQAGGSELEDPLVVRPTSETVIADAMSRWIRSHRDLPLLLNQWANVVRWEMRPRLFLRTSEFLWQEGHTAHASWDDAQAETLRILNEVYFPVLDGALGVPVIRGRKTEAQRFAGAAVTYTLEGLMRDGKALQMGTSHNLGQNFAEAFDIAYLDASGERQLACTTSWGASTRLIGGIIMTHGDDRGLRLPPAIAPVEVLVIPLKDAERPVAERLVAEIAARGARAKLDARTDRPFGRRRVDCELKGVPLRVEIGAREVAESTAQVVRRDTDAKLSLPQSELAARVPDLLADVSRTLYAEATARRDALTREVRSPAEIDGPGFFVIPWDTLGRESGEAELAQRGYTVRCLTSEARETPTAHGAEPLLAWVAKAY